MPATCRLLSRVEIEKIGTNTNIRAHFVANKIYYMAFANNIRNNLGQNGDFTIFDLVKSISDYILGMAGITQLYALEGQGFSAEKLSGLFARLCWEYPNLDQEAIDEMGL